MILHYITFTKFTYETFINFTIPGLQLFIFSVIFIIIHPPSAMDGDGKWPPKSNEPKERSKRSSNAETETLESLKSLESLNLLKYFGWCLENIWELCSICSKREKTTCWNLKERCVFLFPGFFGPEIWQFNSEHMEHMALYADERWTWLSHQQIVDFDWTVNSFKQILTCWLF